LAIWALYYVGNYAWISLMPELYVKHGLELRGSLWLTAVTSLGFVVGSLTAVHFAERAERKWICAAAAAGWSLLLLAVGWLASLPVVAAAGFFASASISLFIPLMYTYTGENFPTPARATCVAMTDGLGHIGGMFCAPIVLAAYDLFQTWGFGFQGALSTMAITGLAAAAILTAGPRTRGHSL
jgi:putative MFS transporter